MYMSISPVVPDNPGLPIVKVVIVAPSYGRPEAIAGEDNLLVHQNSPQLGS